jgi:type II secretory pathway pseudopilin PulG
VTCDERRELLLLLAAGALTPAEQDDLRQHLATGCPRCASALAEAESTVAHLPLTLPAESPSPAVRDQLMRRVLADKTSPRSAGVPWLALAAAACFGIVIGSLLWQTTLGNQRADRIHELETALADRNSRLEEIQTAIGAPSLSFIPVAAQPAQPSAARGRILWDKQANQWHVYVFDMAPPTAGQQYQLWFVTADQQKVSAGVFDVDSNGDASMVVSVPANLGPIALAAVTNEPAGGLAQPTGNFQLLGNVPAAQ